jgi:hypothetical protein
LECKASNSAFEISCTSKSSRGSPRDFASIGQNPDGAVAHRDGLGLAITFSAGFVIIIELRGWGKRAHDMYSYEHYRQVRIFGTMPAVREVFRVRRSSAFYGLETSPGSRMARKRRSKDQLKEIDALVERLREFIRLNYMTAAELARQIGVRDSTIYDRLLGRARPANPDRIDAFLDSLPTENGSGIAPTGYEYREYKNWRGIPALQAGEGRDSESAWCVCRCLSSVKILS